MQTFIRCCVQLVFSGIAVNNYIMSSRISSLVRSQDWHLHISYNELYWYDLRPTWYIHIYIYIYTSHIHLLHGRSTVLWNIRYMSLTEFLNTDCLNHSLVVWGDMGSAYQMEFIRVFAVLSAKRMLMALFCFCFVFLLWLRHQFLWIYVM